MQVPTSPRFAMSTSPASPSTGPWYFGWNIVAASLLLTLLTVGMRMGIGPFMLPMSEDLGFTRSLLSCLLLSEFLLTL